MIRRPPALPFAALALLGTLAARAAAPAAAPVTPSSVLEAAPAGDWEPLDPGNLLVMRLANGGTAVIDLADAFAPAHLGNIRRLVAARFFDGLWVERVQDGYVTQWGDPDGRKPLPAGVDPHPAADYERPAAGLAFRPLRYRDTFAAQVGFVGRWPVGVEGGRAWLTHCYGMVGVGRDNTPDTGTGTELYAVIGQAPRQLDRNIALVGRVVWGMDALAALPRGQGAMGFYADPKSRLAITSARLASELPEGERPRLEVLRTDRPSFAAWVRARANRQDAFYSRPAGAVDLCNAMPPVRSR